MGWFVNGVKSGFSSSIGSLGAMAVFGLFILIGIWLLMVSRADPKTGKQKNTPLMVLAIAFLVIGSLPFLPLLGIQVLGGMLD